MTRNDINKWIASYTVSNAKYMKSGIDIAHYNCYEDEGKYGQYSYLYTLQNNLCIPSGEKLLSFFEIGIMSSCEKGLAFTENGVYGRDKIGNRYHYNYSDYNSFYESYSGFINSNVREIMHNIYKQISEYEKQLAQAQLAKRNNTIKKVTGGGIATIATALAGISAWAMAEKDKSDAFEQSKIEDILSELEDLFKE